MRMPVRLRKYKRLLYVQRKRKKTKKPIAPRTLRLRQRRRKNRMPVICLIIAVALFIAILLVKAIIPLFFHRIRLDDVTAFKIPPEEIGFIYEICEEQDIEPVGALTAYCIYNKFFNQKRMAYTKEQIAADFFPKIDKIKASISEKRYNRYYYVIDTLISEIKSFPLDISESYIFGDTWGIINKMCGAKKHNGADIYDRENIKGRLPVHSMTAGIVESAGKKSGGYYVGVRTEKGSFYLYDHLEAAENIETGSPVAAGTILGSMGGGKDDPANVHIGIKLNSDLKKGGIWINPYPILRYFESVR